MRPPFAKTSTRGMGTFAERENSLHLKGGLAAAYVRGLISSIAWRVGRKRVQRGAGLGTAVSGIDMLRLRSQHAIQSSNNKVFPV